jgi:hypothetical protein
MVENLEITSSPRNHSVAVVKVVFRRQMGFHVITTFVQTMVIILVAFVTFFFNIRNFSDRIMVNLVLLLVLSTMSSSAQAVSIILFLECSAGSNDHFVVIGGGGGGGGVPSFVLFDGRRLGGEIFGRNFCRFSSQFSVI